MGHTFKDSREHYDDKPTNRYYRKMKHVKKIKKEVAITRCGTNGKVAFPTIEAAQQRANEILASDYVRDGVTKFRVYHCPHCLKYHITKTEFR